MSSPPPPDDTVDDLPLDSEMHGEEHEGEDEEGEGDDAMLSDDSSEEEEEDPEEERKIREGFIVDEDEEEEGGEPEEEAKVEKKKRRKHKRRRHRDEDADEVDGELLDEDDLMLVEENTGQRLDAERFSRVRRHRSPSPAGDSRATKRRRTDVGDDDSLPEVDELANIFAKDREVDDEGEDDLDDFIEEDDDEELEEERGMDEEEKEERRKARKQELKERRALARDRPQVPGLDDEAMDDLKGVFGEGNEYDWYFEADEEEPEEKPPNKVEDVFEPSEIKARMLTHEDDLIRKDDVPERMLLSASALYSGATYVPLPHFSPGELDSASYWVGLRISDRVKESFFFPDGPHHYLLHNLILAIHSVLEYILIDHFEVPYIWHHKRDYISHFDAEGTRQRTDLLTLEELWKIQTLGYRYRALVERRTALKESFDKLSVTDRYFSDHVWESLDNTEVVADAMEYVTMRHGRRIREMRELAEADARRAEAEAGEDVLPKPHKPKRPTRQSAYEVARNSTLSGLADSFGISPHDVVLHFLKRGSPPAQHEPEVSPIALAEQYAPEGWTGTTDELLERARYILATELGKDPLLRHMVRQKFEKEAVVTTRPTEQGLVKIDEYHPYFRIKYMNKKPIQRLATNTLFLQVLAAEHAGLLTVDISVPANILADFQTDLYKAYANDRFSEVALAWNEQRRMVVDEAMKKHLVPGGVKWIREWLKDEEEDCLAEACTEMLERRLDCAPYRTKHMEEREVDTPSVLALSVGKGETDDAIVAVFLDASGHMRESTKFDNLRDENIQDTFKAFVKRRNPDVIGVAGFSIQTARLLEDVRRTVGNPGEEFNKDEGGGGEQSSGWGGGGGGGDQNGGSSAWGTGANSGWSGNDSGWGSRGGANGANGQDREEEDKYPDIIYVPDEVARIYQNSPRAVQEFSGLSVIARYCVGLARYVQNPVNEYAALGEDISLVKLDDDQKLLPKPKLLAAMERALVTIVNKTGVDITRAISDIYYQYLLRFVCGLGPRKAQNIVRKIVSKDGIIENRARFVKDEIMGWNIFVNAAAFLIIPQEAGNLSRKNEGIEEQPDILDETRIHPEDYELARKMATDALDMDEEDFVNDHPSAAVAQLMQHEDAVRKLDELSLDDFAINLLERLNDRKRYTLDMLKEELVNPYRDKREPFAVPNDWQVMTMLTGETRRTLYVGRPVSAIIFRVKQHFANGRLDSGVEAVINQMNLSDDSSARIEEVLSRGQTVSGTVIDVVPARLLAELATKESALRSAHPLFPKNNIEDFDLDQHERDQEALQRKKRREINATRRIIKHPDFRKFNAGQAEQYLAGRPKGDVVIRPSSKGPDHLVVTWKVDDGVYQHIDVFDPDSGNDQSGASHRLVVGAYVYSDLDELLVNHVNALAKRVNDLMEHEKFFKGNDDQRRQHLMDFVMANPSKSVYAFGLDRQHPGYFVVDFMVNKNIPMQSWPVKVTPRGYRLLDGGESPSVPELCNAFKMRYVQQMTQVATGRPAGGKTPYGAGTTPYGAGGLTPSAHTPGYRSSTHLPVGRTPNPYGGASHTPNPYGQTPRPVPPAGGGGYGYGSGPGGVPQSPYPGATPAATGWGAQAQGTPAGGGWGAGGGGW